MELTAKVKCVLPTQSGQGRNGEWVKNLFVVEWTENGYTQNLCLEVVGADKWEKMKNAVVVGHEVLVKFSVSSREWNGRWFTTANCYYCSTVGGFGQNGGGHQQQSSRPSNDPAYSASTNQPTRQDDNLPF